MTALRPRRAVYAWALYDWANSAFATTVMVAFFPVFFRQYWSLGAGADTTARLSFANTVASVCVALLAPWLGALADRGGRRTSLLAIFTALGVMSTALLAIVGYGHWALAAAVFVIASVGFFGANIFYDSMLLTVARGAELDRVSSLGYGLGYMGGGLLLVLNAWMTLSPSTFGFDDAATAVRASFVTVAVWWALFAVPLLVTIKNAPPRQRPALVRAAIDATRELGATLRELRSYRAVWLFLLAYWLYIDGVYTVQKLAVEFGLSIGFSSGDLIKALLLTQFVAFPASIGFGALAGRIGPRRAILIGVAAYAAMTIWAFTMRHVAEFYGLAIGVGLVQGGVQSLSRSLFGRLVPPDRAGEFFGFFNMWGKFAAVLGPALVGIVAMASGSSRSAMLSLIVLFGAGAWLLWRVPDVGNGREL
jgi:MFS transporter, UMF1 family